MSENRITIDLGYGPEIAYQNPLYSGDYLRSLSEVYDWDTSYGKGVFSFDWMYKICVF